METGVAVTLGIFVAGLVFSAGRLTVRIERLEEWKGTTEKHLDAVFRALRRIEKRLGVEEED